MWGGRGGGEEEEKEEMREDQEVSGRSILIYGSPRGNILRSHPDAPFSYAHGQFGGIPKCV